MQFALLAAAAVVVGISCPWLIASLFGAEFAPAVAPVRALLLGTVLLGHGTLATGVLVGRRENSYLAKCGAAVVLGFAVLDAWLVPSGGALAAAWVSTFLYSIYSVLLTQRVFDGRWRRVLISLTPRVPALRSSR